MINITGALIQKVVELYASNGSILDTAKAAGISTVKVRKILITEGLWESDTSLKIGALLERGLTTEQIAKALYMSVKNVQAYMPYERGVYGGEELSRDAVRADRYRKRMKKAANMQVLKMKDEDAALERKEGREKKRAVDEKENVNRMDKASKGGERRMDKVLKLHLELDMQYVDERERQILKKYGGMEHSIAREVLVPGDITLHALSYAILRMFGWQNGHLHKFSLPEDVFQKLTENRFLTWAKMTGVYFRFPTENYGDIYWDDDYKEWESIRSWMRKKYTGPYKYKGFSEYYLMNQMEVTGMLRRWPKITVQEFDWEKHTAAEPYSVRLAEATVDQVMDSFADVTCYELIERAAVADILQPKNSGRISYDSIRKYVEGQTGNFDVDEACEEYNIRRFSSEKQEREFLEKYDIPVLPATEQLNYSYDYGDGWKVLITCEDVYEQDEHGVWCDRGGEPAEVLSAELEEVAAKHRPVCIAKDGIELVDDVGGIGGFCEMLQIIYEADVLDENQAEARDNMIGWAEMMGWNGRKRSPKQTL